MHKSLLIASLFLVSASSSAADSANRSYPLPKHGAFELKVPLVWKDSVRQPPNDLPPTISFAQKDGAAFEVLVTPMWAFRPDVTMPTPEETKSTVRRAADEAQQQAVEKTIEVKELKGTSATGYYFSATDRAPKPGEYKYLTQGMLSTGDLRVTFTILTNDGQEQIAQSALAMLASAAHR